MTTDEREPVPRILFALVAIASAIRLLSVFWLHPLNWDEVEYFRATDWVRQGLVPFRDFWEHHTPLQWFVFAPFTALTESPGTDAIVLMRLFQVPLWILTFTLMNWWMRDAGIGARARWVAIAVAVSSSLLMIPAVEYRVDALACTLFALALVLLQRRRDFAAGVVLCFVGFANLRFGPLLALTALLHLFTREKRWKLSPRALVLILGVGAAGALGIAYLLSTDSLRPLYQHVWVDNYIGEQSAKRIPFSFAHRLLVPFGIRLYGAGDRFDLAGVDLAGASLLVAGFAGLVIALRRWRQADDLFFLACLQLANVLFIARMKFVYHYHLEIVAVLMVPFVALAVPRVRAALPLVAIFVLASVMAVTLRGKERDFAYQDLIMREVHAQTSPGAKVFDGVGWALRRMPAYRFWFLPELTRQLVARGLAQPYGLREWLADPPAAVVTDRNAVIWLLQNPPLRSYVTHHYLPLWRNLWLPGLSARLAPGQSIEWIAPADGRYRIMASRALAVHPWFDQPFGYSRSGSGRIRAMPRRDASVAFAKNGSAVDVGRGVVTLRKRDRLRATSSDVQPIGIFATAGDERTWFREPPSDVTLDAEGPRMTHIPLLH